MQNAMQDVNHNNQANGLPELEMGIGLNETEVIVGNIGTDQRSKYAVVGSGVNMTSRIESYTVGGQILISESMYNQIGHLLRIDAQRDILPKGSEASLRVYEVGGISGSHNIALNKGMVAQVSLAGRISITYKILERKNVHDETFNGFIEKLSRTDAEATLDYPVDIYTNLKMDLGGVDHSLSTKPFYGKVIRLSDKNEKVYTIRFTSVPPEIEAYFQALRRYYS